MPANIAPKSGSQSGQVFYCPGTIPPGTQYHFNYVRPGNPAQSNPWIGWPGYTTRITYSLRFEYCVWDTFQLELLFVVQYPNARFNLDKTTASSDAFLVPATNKRPVFPRLSTFNRGSASAIVMDLNDSTFNRMAVHRGGVNVLCANWAAKYVPQEYIARHVKNIEIQSAAYPNGAPAVRRAWFDLWQELDRY